MVALGNRRGSISHWASLGTAPPMNAHSYFLGTLILIAIIYAEPEGCQRTPSNSLEPPPRGMAWDGERKR